MGKQKSIVAVVFILIFALLLAVAGILAQGQAATAAPEASVGTAFSYQGHLSANGTTANGIYDFQFRLYAAPTGGTQIGTTIARGDVTVEDGLFNVLLDFGNVFDGNARYLEIGVRDGNSSDNYELLAPRQLLTPTPYAITSLNVPAHDHWGESWSGNGTALELVGGEYGIVITSTSKYGIDVDSTGVGIQVKSRFHGVDVAGAGTEGFEVDYAGRYGVGIDYAGQDGIHVDRAGEYAGYFGGAVYISGDCTGCNLATFAVNQSPTVLEPGDLVTARATRSGETVGEAVLLEVTRATSGQSVIGVVQGYAELTEAQTEFWDEATGTQTEELRPRLVPRQGPVEPGQYASILIYGITQVRATALATPIEAGSRLALDSGGAVRALQTTTLDGLTLAESAPTVGTALQELPAGSDDALIWVLINPQ